MQQAAIRRPEVIALAIATMLCAICTFLALVPEDASASQRVYRNASRVRLKVNNKGVALVTFRGGGKNHHVLYWGAVNSNRYFKYDRSGGWKSHKADWKNFTNKCRRYRGPALKRPYGQASAAHPVVKINAVCTAPDGSHWMLQTWKRLVRHQGTGSYASADRELRISHWKGSYATLTANSNWVNGGTRLQIYGQFKYKGKPWYALTWGSTGQVTDGVGRNMFIDSADSDFGTGWWRVNSILTHKPSGQYCYIFGPKPPVTNNTGYSPVKKYRIGVPGPGVSPDIFLSFYGYTLAEYDPVIDDQHDAAISALIGTYTGPHGCNTNN